jgi:transposase
MRRNDQQQADMFSYLSTEQRARTDHPLRAVRALTVEILKAMSRLFDAMYAECGWPSISPEKLLRTLLLRMLYSVRSE